MSTSSMVSQHVPELLNVFSVDSIQKQGRNDVSHGKKKVHEFFDGLLLLLVVLGFTFPTDKKLAY